MTLEKPGAVQQDRMVKQTHNLPSIREAATDLSHVGKSREEQKQNLNALTQRFNAISFTDKFARQKERREGRRAGQTFEIGEKVGTCFIVQQVKTPDGKIDKTKLELLVADNVTGDVRNNDMFLVDASPEDWEAAQQFAGMPFNGVVEITGNEQYVVSNTYRYPARAEHLECAVPVNPEIQEMQEGTSVLVEGEIMSFEVTDYWDFKEERRPKTAVMQVKAPDGRIVPVEIDPNVKFEPSPTMENICGKVPEVGDTVRISATVVKQDESATKKLYAPWCRSTYLLKPSEKRAKEFEELRVSVEKKFEDLNTSLQSNNYPAARLSIGKIMKDEVSEVERAQLETLVATIPEIERPLMHWKRYEVVELNKAYNTDVDAMTKQEFYDFMKDTVQKPFTGTERNRKGDHSYLYRIMDDINMPQAQREELMALAAQTRWDYFKQKNAEDYDHDTEWSDSYMLDQSLIYLPREIESFERTKKFITLLGEILTSDWEREFYNAERSLELLAETAKKKPDVLKALKESAPILQSIRTKIEGSDSNSNQKQRLLAYVDSALKSTEEK